MAQPQPAFNLEQERKDLKSYVQSYNPEAPFDIKMRDFMMRTIEPFTRKGNCLQLGCGHGEQTLILAQNFERVTVLEAVGEFIAYTKEQAQIQGIKNIDFIHDMAESFETHKKYENIILSHVLEHIYDDRLVLERLIACLSDQGRLFVIVPNANAASRLLAVKMGLLDHTESLSKADLDAGHRRMYHMDKLCDIARKAGGHIVHTGGIFFKPLANFQFDALMGGDLISDDYIEACYALGKEYPSLCASIYVVIENK